MNTNNQYPSSSFLFTIEALRNSALVVLELSTDASIFEVKIQYMKLAVKHYSNSVVEGGDEKKKIAAHDRFSKVSAAYELLSNYGSREEDMLNVLSGLSFTDPYQLLKQHGFVDIKSTEIVTNPFREYTNALFSAEQEQKRIRETAITPPESPDSSAFYEDYRETKRTKLVNVPSPPLLIRKSVKRDSSFVRMTVNEQSPYSFQMNSKRRRRTIMG